MRHGCEREPRRTTERGGSSADLESVNTHTHTHTHCSSRGFLHGGSPVSVVGLSSGGGAAGAGEAEGGGEQYPETQ